MKFAFIFPGQGSQFIGMGKALAKDFPAAKAVFEEVDEALQQDLSGLMWAGSKDQLQQTENTQPALMAVSVAAIAALGSTGAPAIEKATFIAGHSLGEYAALTAAGAISVSDCARILRLRGAAMQQAVPQGQGAMAALLGASPEQAQALCTQASKVGICEIANDNAPGQIVISGSKTAIDLACARAGSQGIKKAVPLAVSAPFHCSLMQPAAEAMAAALADTNVRAPCVPLITNVTAMPELDPAILKKRLVEQVTGRVRWRETVAYLASQGVDLTIEAGAGQVLSVMNRRTARSISGLTMADRETVEIVAARLCA